MDEMSAVTAANSDQINADDLVSGPITITILAVKINLSEQQKVSVSFAGSERVWRPCKTCSRVMVAAWGAEKSAYAGKSLTLYRDPKVLWSGAQVGGIRISHMSHIDRDFTIALAESRQKRVMTTVKMLKSADATIGPDIEPPKADTSAQAEARTVARKGKAAFVAWWNSAEGKKARPSCEPIMAELQKMVVEADAPKPDMEADPFGLPPVAADDPDYSAKERDITDPPST